MNHQMTSRFYRNATQNRGFVYKGFMAYVRAIEEISYERESKQERSSPMHMLGFLFSWRNASIMTQPAALRFYSALSLSLYLCMIASNALHIEGAKWRIHFLLYLDP